jgi:plastocyanin
MLIRYERAVYVALIATAVTLAAGCTQKGGDNAAANAAGAASTPAAGGSTSTTTPAPAAESGMAGGAGAAGGAPAPITGKTVTVNMVGDAKGYRFEPNNLTIKVGDGVKWVNVTGGPHNVTFWSDSIPAGAAAKLGANMPQTTAPLTGPLLVTPNQTYTVSFAGLPPGTYHFYCTPHLALGMIGKITVQ